MTLARFLGSPRKRFLIINVLGDSKASSRVDIKLMDRRELETIYPGMLDSQRSDRSSQHEDREALAQERGRG